jgi:hypothetical protein
VKKTALARLEALEAQEAARIDAMIYRFALASARVWNALTLDEYLTGMEISSRPERRAQTDAEDVVITRIEALEAAEGLPALAAPLERLMGRGALVRRRDALVIALIAREDAGTPLTLEEKVLCGAPSAWARLLARVSSDDFDALCAAEGDAHQHLARELAAHYPEPQAP